jgi:succinylglutamate desuccinylase
LKYVHRIQAGDQFKMRPGYINFQRIQQQEHLADDITGPIYAPMNGLILMPLYQSKGSDGFFIVEAQDAGPV